MGAAKTYRQKRYRLTLAPSATAGPCSRHALKLRLTEWGMPDLFPDAAVILGELVSNALRIGDFFTFVLRIDGSDLVIEVADSSPEFPGLRPDPLADLDNDDFDQNGGRGLLLVASLAAEWGCAPHKGGKTVWARLRLTLFEAEFRRPAYGTTVSRYVTFHSGGSSAADVLEARAWARLAELRPTSGAPWELVGIRRRDEQTAGEPAGAAR